MPRRLPSGSQLPESSWDASMDRFICTLDAEGEIDVWEIVRKLKRRFPILHQHVITPEAIGRRINVLDDQDNNFFKIGSIKACANVHANGIRLPDFDPDVYLSRPVKRATSLSKKSGAGIRAVIEDNQLDEEIRAVTGGFEGMIFSGTENGNTLVTSQATAAAKNGQGKTGTIMRSAPTDTPFTKNSQLGPPRQTPVAGTTNLHGRGMGNTTGLSTSYAPLRSPTLLAGDLAHTPPRTSSIQSPTARSMSRAASDSSRVSTTTTGHGSQRANGTDFHTSSPYSQMRRSRTSTEGGGSPDAFGSTLRTVNDDEIFVTSSANGSPSAGRRERHRPHELDLSGVHALKPKNSFATRGAAKENEPITATATSDGSDSTTTSAFKKWIAKMGRSNSTS